MICFYFYFSFLLLMLIWGDSTKFSEEDIKVSWRSFSNMKKALKRSFIYLYSLYLFQMSLYLPFSNFYSLPSLPPIKCSFSSSFFIFFLSMIGSSAWGEGSAGMGCWLRRWCQWNMDLSKMSNSGHGSLMVVSNGASTTRWCDISITQGSSRT